MGEVQEALAGVLGVHETDGLMHLEFLGPFRELNEVRRPEPTMSAMQYT